ncbi:MAG: hypothetical protein AAF205_12315, partial [Pseudomonadota bacterium]
MTADQSSARGGDGFTPGFHQHDTPAVLDGFSGPARRAGAAIADSDDAALARVLSTDPDVVRAVAGPVDLLTFAMAHRNRDAFERLLDAGAPVDGADPAAGTYSTRTGTVEGGTYSPIYYSLELKDPWWFERLIAAGADPDGIGRDGTFALERALLGEDRSRALALVAAGADVTRDVGAGNTYAHKAAIGNKFDVVEALMAKGADMWRASDIGATPAYLVANPTAVMVGDPGEVEPIRRRLLTKLQANAPAWPPAPPEE